MDPNVSLTLSKRADETLWGKAISGLGRMVYSSSFNIYVLLIATKRSSVLRAFNNYININNYKDENKREAIREKYKKAFSNYIGTIEKYITENIYTKMQKGSASIEEGHIMSKYYEVCKYKNNDQVLYRTKLEILALNTDWNTVQSTKSEEFLSKYKAFYLYNIEESYKNQIRHDAILLANAKPGDRDQYEAVYTLIDTYIKEVLPILPESDENNAIIKDYRKYVAAIDVYDKKDFLELRKRITLLGFTRDLFEFAFPMVAREQCYKEILEIARIILTNYYTDAEKFACYEVILDAIEEYAENVLAYKTYWETEDNKKAYQKFNEKFTTLKKLARIDYEQYKKQREILFIKYDMFFMDADKIKLPEVRDYYRERLIINHALRILKAKAKLHSGVCYSKRQKFKDRIVSKGSPIENIISEISEIANKQFEDYKKKVECFEEYAKEKAQRNATKETDNLQKKSIFNVVRYLTSNGKKYKKRKAF